ncbi:MAG TPA: hypothetical protein VGD65_00445 [Chryseosolibacter sp.]
MFVPFEKLPNSARLWIFKGERKFSAEELAIIHNRLQFFTNGWSAHGQPLQTSYLVLEDLFIVLAADETFRPASGCSIDDSVHAIREIGNLIHQDLFRRDLVSFKMGEKIETMKISDLKTAFKEGRWNENTLTFNILAGTKSQLDRAWLVSAKDTWLKRYIATEEVAR